MTRMYYFELYILHDGISQDAWSKLQKAVQGQVGLFGWFVITFRCVDNVVRFFVSAVHDIGALSNSIDGMLLRPVAKEEVFPPSTKKRELFVQLPSSGNILDLRERFSIRKHKTLQYAECRVHGLGPAKLKLFFEDGGGQWTTATKYVKRLPLNLFAIQFGGNTHYLKRRIPTHLDIEKSLSILSSERSSALFSVDTFPYLPKDYYLNLARYEFDKHSFIIGSSGSGKSKLIELMIDRLQGTAMAMNYRVVVIDPHASLEHDLRLVPSSKVINFGGESAQLFPRATPDISAATELTTTLLKSLMSDTPSPRLERVLRFALHVLFVGQCMSLPMLKSFLTDLDVRGQLLDHVRGFVPDNVVTFFGSEYNEIRTQHYSEAVSPIIVLIDEMQLQPALLGEADVSLAKTIQDNFLTVFSLNKVSMGDKVVKTVAGLLIQQIFLLAQARAFGQRVILIVDEVSVVQNPALASILAEARKFNLTVILTQQYFGQIEKNLRHAILSNVLNYYVFRVSEEDARALEANITMELPKELVVEAAKRGLRETDVRAKLMTELHPRECLVRVAANGQIVPAVRARTMDAPIRSAEAGLRGSLDAYRKQELPAQFVPGQPAKALVSLPASPEPVQMPEAHAGPPPDIFSVLSQQSSSHKPITKNDEL